MMGQLGFAEAFLADKAGQNRRLERIASLIDFSLAANAVELQLKAIAFNLRRAAALANP